MLDLAQRWRPYRSLAVSYLFASEYDEPTTQPQPDDGRNGERS
jgi:3-methyladenine DNA glycosylase/8-oxoguanine DNA glycosylase